MATVLVPTPLRRLTNGESKVLASGDSIAAVFRAVNEQYPGFDEKLIDDEGNVKRFINVFVNNDEIRTLQGMETPVSDSDQVSIVPAMAGGAEAHHE
jgi:molybdopterin synthase sulfur carrier subunit